MYGLCKAKKTDTVSRVMMVSTYLLPMLFKTFTSYVYNMDKKAEIQKFEELTGLNYYKAMENYFIEIGTNLICLDEAQLETLSDDIFKKWLDKLYSLCSTYVWRRNVKKTSEHYKELTRTFIKCTSKSPKTSQHDALMLEMVDKDKVLDVLCRHNKLAFNPFFMVNDWRPSEFTSVMVLDTKIIKQLWYITNVYNWHNIYKQKVNTKAYEVTEYRPIPKTCVKKVFWNMYTPYVRWLIQTEQFSKLIISFDELKENLS